MNWEALQNDCRQSGMTADETQDVLVECFRLWKSGGSAQSMDDIIRSAIRHVRHGRREQTMDRKPCGSLKVRYTFTDLSEFTSRDHTDTVAFKLDATRWVRRLPTIKRTVLNFALEGYRTSEIAQLIGTSKGRVSQIRRELVESWQAYEKACRS